MDSSSSSEGDVMGWVVGCGGRIYFGPPPNTADNLRYLRKTLGIRNIVSLKPLTGRLTAPNRYDSEGNRYDTSIWYAKKDAKITVHTCPLANQSAMDSMKDADVVEVYIGLARKIAGDMDGAPVYIHHRDGFTHEAYVAMAMWRLEAGPTVAGIPRDPVAWLADHGHIQVVRMAAEKQMLARVWARTCTYATGIGAVFAKMRKAGEQGGQRKKRKKGK